MSIESLRVEIDDIDGKLVALLEKRMALVKQVASLKQDQKLAVLDSNREHEKLSQVAILVENPLYQEAVVATFQSIMDHSRAFQKQQISGKSLDD
ncbi:chorismate mutase [Streptococcus didelphis]|uniref:Chorismate mutase n=1 Tax=Streptococcus didelphis TaxID=102886 RepID=A0ABY9LHT6_9STRE|nr:chorismate mutase [Streptococcus didelphis]WMB28407.1 chorismate mutase [Streptococcus didelphis]WMB29086.1 chorismate mutase [Streptococcus didelphis]